MTPEHIEELERAAYIKGDTQTAALLRHIAELDNRVEQLVDELRALLDDDNEKTRADALRALECS
tara:strand:+ start:1221 stop:1415 length:195 start_codon:yes stop_codon:yes gene_type:complete